MSPLTTNQRSPGEVAPQLRNFTHNMHIYCMFINNDKEIDEKTVETSERWGGERKHRDRMAEMQKK